MRRRAIHSVIPGLFLAAAAPFLVCGCRGNGSDLMPLEVGKSWGYLVKAGFSEFYMPSKVTREVSVANTAGYEISNSVGTSRLSWTKDALVSERLLGAQFIPPVPLLFKSEETHERPWKGRVVLVDRAWPATATESQTGDDSIDYGGRKIHCTKSIVLLKTPVHEIELTTWFSSGLGIVRQEQRTDKALLVQLNLLPKEKQ